MTFDIGLSTSWNSWREPDVDKMIDEIISYGFNSVELDFALAKKSVDRMIELVNTGKIKVSSLHNFCPIPDDPDVPYLSPNIFPISSKDPDERSKGVRYTCQTIDYATRLGAKAIVMHIGKVPVKNRTVDLLRLLEQDRQDTRKFMRIKLKLLREREKYRETYLNYTLQSLEEINNYAVGKNILVGIENRNFAHEIPDLEEADYILRHFDGGNLRYWHDVGHAQIMENIGIFSHDEYVNFFKNRIAGIHIHDIVRGRDHRAPGSGLFDFGRIKDFLTADIIKVIEVHHPTSPRELKSGVQFLKTFFEKELNSDKKE